MSAMPGGGGLARVHVAKDEDVDSVFAHGDRFVSHCSKEKEANSIQRSARATAAGRDL